MTRAGTHGNLEGERGTGREGTQGEQSAAAGGEAEAVSEVPLRFQTGEALGSGEKDALCLEHAVLRSLRYTWVGTSGSWKYGSVA